MLMSPALKKFIISIGDNLSDSGFPKIIIDLSQCDYMDSTFLGTILLANRMIYKSNGKFIEIAKPTKFCKNLLTQMGLDKYFPIIDLDYDNSGGRIELDEEQLEGLEKANFLLQTHKALSDVNELNKTKFALVTKLLQEEILKLKNNNE